MSIERPSAVDQLRGAIPRTQPQLPSFSSTHSNVSSILLTPIRRHLRSLGTSSSTLAADYPPSRASPDSSTLRHRFDPEAARPAASALSLERNRPHNLRTQYTPEGSQRVRRYAAAPVRFPINSSATAKVGGENISLSKKEMRVFGKHAHPTRGSARVYAHALTDHL